jgi:hypothetical protein
MSNDKLLLDKRLLVLRRHEENLQLPATKYLAGIAPKDIPSGQYVAFRVDRFESETGELWLKYERGIYDARAFEISTEVNSEALLAHDIKKVCIINQYSNAYVTSKSFNSDINLNQRLNATKSLYQETQTKEQPQAATLIQEILLPVNDIRFEDGKASFDVFINHVLKLRKFEVENPFLKKEYDAIKNYFAKALHTKKFSAIIKIESIGTEIIHQSATCSQIDQIDDSLLERIEDYIIEDEFLSNEDDIIIPEDILETAAKALGKEDVNADWLLNKLITPERTKHYYHLRFLSSKHAASILHLRLTGKPLSFIFLLQSDDSYFLVWETYKTEEATYVWKLDGADHSELKREVKKLMDRIRWLRKANKLTYINSKPENFKRIEHDYGGEDNGFKKWREQLVEFTTKV